MFKNMKLRTRMLVSIGSIAFVAFAVTICFVAVKASTMAKEEAFGKVNETGYRYSNEVKGALDSAMSTARTIAQMFEGMKKSGGPLDRSVAIKMMEKVLEQNPTFVGISTGWEPGAFDGNDGEFVDTTGHDGTGRFIPYVCRGAEGISLEALVDYETPGVGDYYLIPKKTGEEVILDPYVYPVAGKDVLMTSLMVPIKYESKFVGVVGIDLTLTSLSDLVSQIKPFDNGYAFLVSNNGSIAAHPKSGLVGTNFKDNGASTDALSAISEGKLFSQRTESDELGSEYAQYVPCTIGQTDSPWSFAIVVPMDKVMAKARNMVYSTIGIGVISLSVLIAVVYLIAVGISKPINRIVSVLSDGTSQVSSASGQVSSASQSLAEGATEQAAGLEETSSSLEEMSSMTKQNADNAQQANVLATEAHNAAQVGVESMLRMSRAIDDIQNSSDQTAKIIKVIDEIAFQTNLLALNAAVEAARAGEAGKGFAVVAEEVRNLAMRSAEAAKNTTHMIDESVKNAQNGVGISNEVSSALEKIVNGIAKTTDLVGEIAAASAEQAQGIDQVNTAVAQMDKVTQQNAANAEESASASEQLSAQANSMKSMVDELVQLVEGVVAGNVSRTTEVARVVGKNYDLAEVEQISSEKKPEFIFN